MAGDWIKIRCGLAKEREILALRKLLKLPRAHVVGLCVQFWSWADALTSDGLIRGVDFDDIDEIMALPGFAAALEAVQWLNKTHNGVEVPEFTKHNGHSAKLRLEAAERKQQQRDRNKSVTDVT